jgi:porin
MRTCVRFSCFAFSAMALGLATQAVAQSDQPSPTGSFDQPQQGQTEQTSPAGSIPTKPAAPQGDDDTAKYKRFDSLAEPGLTTNFPGSADSVLRDAGGIRSWLADHETGLEMRYSAVAVGNPLGTGQPASPQYYNGQRTTLQDTAFNIILTKGLGSIGLPNSRIIVGGEFLGTTFKPNGPTTGTVLDAAYYQTFDHGKIELKAGIAPNIYEYVGFYAGGSPVLAAGTSGLIPIQAGLSSDPAPVPMANLTFHFKQGAYLKMGVQRSISPLGYIDEVKHNGIGLAVQMHGAGPLTIAEVGINRPATPDGRQIWVRVGGLYNQSDYVRFDGKGTSDNQAAYAAADFQVTKPDRTAPARGLYAGASAFWGNPKVDSFTQTYELRVYDVGLLKGRPSDSAAIRLGYTKFSNQAYDANKQLGIFSNHNQMTATASYTVHLSHGIYATPSIAYLHHPSFEQDFRDALNLTGSVFVLF